MVVHWNAPDLLSGSVASILGSAGVDVEVLVVDNASSSMPEDLPDDVGVLRLETNTGYTGGANRGLGVMMDRSEPAPYIAVAAHDAMLEETGLVRLVEVLESDPTIGLVGPLLTAPARVAGARWNGRRGHFVGAADLATSHPVDRDWLSGTFIVGRREVWAALGGFDERFGSYIEDIDICLRAGDAGWRVVVVPDAVAAGRGSRSRRVTELVDVNSALLALKRGGVGEFSKALGTYVYWIPRGLVAALAPKRSRQRRASSARHAIDHARALSSLVAHPARALDFHRRGPDHPAGASPAHSTSRPT